MITIVKEFKIPDNFKKVVVGFITDTGTRFCGIAFYDRQGNQLLTLGYLDHPVETILDKDERIVGIASRNEGFAIQYDF